MSDQFFSNNTAKINISPVDIKALTNRVPDQSIVKGLKEALAELMQKLGVKEPNWLSFRVDDKITLPLKDFIPHVVKTNNATVIPKIRRISKNSSYLNTIIPMAGENNLKLSKGETNPAAFANITIDLNYGQPVNVAAGQIPNVAQNINVNALRTEAVKPETSLEGANKMYYSNRGIKLMLGELGYPKLSYKVKVA